LNQLSAADERAPSHAPNGGLADGLDEAKAAFRGTGAGIAHVEKAIINQYISR